MSTSQKRSLYVRKTTAQFSKKCKKDLEELVHTFDSLQKESERCKELKEKMNASHQKLREYTREISEIIARMTHRHNRSCKKWEKLMEEFEIPPPPKKNREEEPDR